MNGDKVISLTPKEFALLKLLVENRGRTVEKDEILENIWSETFVEEGTLTRNVSWLRKKLAAHTDAKIIETVPKIGYRFLPEISKTPLIVQERTIQQIQIEEIIEVEDDFVLQLLDEKTPKTKALPPKAKNRNYWFFSVVLILVTVVLTYALFTAKNQPEIILASKIVPFSGLPGRESSPAFSPDGKQLVFAWDGDAGKRNFDIYVKLIGTGEPVRLTETIEEETNPVFSPDGKSIAFLRVFPDRNEIILKPALGGAERKIYENAGYASLSFSPDGKLIAYAELNSSTQEAGIFTINLQTGEKKRITIPPVPMVDHTPRFSPDGKYLAFIRYFNSFKREIFIVPATGGEPHQITFDDARIYGLAWNKHNGNLLFTSYRNSNQLNLWRISADGNEAQMISTGSKNLNDLAISPDGKTVAFVEETADENIWEILPNQLPNSIIRSTRADHSQQFSPDGTQIVFASERTGNYEIWIADADGKNQRQLTEKNGSTGSPRFSPDGKFIVYDAQTAGTSDIFIVSTTGGEPRRLTENAKNNALPAWSIDGKWIFFQSNRTGNEQIWKMSASGGEAVQITKQGAFEMFAAPDGKTIIYSKGMAKSGLWSVSTDGADEKPIPELAEAGAWRSWTVTSSGVYFTAFALKVPLQIKFYDFANRQVWEVTKVDKPPLNYYQNLSVSPAGTRILYARQDQISSGIMLAELTE